MRGRDATEIKAACEAERRLAPLRLAVLAFGTAMFPLLDHTMPRIGWTVLALAWAYSLWILFFAPYERHPILTTPLYLSLTDGTFIVTWLLVTGGIHSPFIPALYGGVVAVALRGGLAWSLPGILVYVASYLAIVALEGEAFDVSVAIQVAYVLFVGCASALIGSQLRAVQHELRLRAEQLAETDRKKDAFLALLGHELRNPLAAVALSLDLLRTARGEWSASVLDMAKRQANRLRRIVDDLLEVSRITHGKIELVTRYIDLTRLVRELYQEHRPRCEERQLELTLAVPPQPIWIHGDPERLFQTFGNLVSNAEKYTDPGGSIRIALSREGERARFTVEDTGMGMSDETMLRIFEPFGQGEESRRKSGGLGLGLSLARQLVELHGGTIEAMSRGPGLGSTFVVCLDACDVVPEEAAAPDEEEESTRPHEGFLVLVVEDDPEIAYLMASLLEQEGIAVKMAHDGTSALEKARELRPDAIICDIGLPGELDGYALARRIGADPDLAGTPMIAVSGFGCEDDVARAISAGFIRHFIKPVDPNTLIACVSKLAEQTRPASDTMMAS